MKTDLDLSHKALASKFIKAVLVIIGVLTALQSIGLDLTVLSVFGGALGVGIGLGLQKLASNYIAGFVILLDARSGWATSSRRDRYGAVTKVTSRYVVVRSLDSVEAIVPNETRSDHGAQPLAVGAGRAGPRSRSRSPMAPTSTGRWPC